MCHSKFEPIVLALVAAVAACERGGHSGMPILHPVLEETEALLGGQRLVGVGAAVQEVEE